MQVVQVKHIYVHIFVDLSRKAYFTDYCLMDFERLVNTAYTIVDCVLLFSSNQFRMSGKTPLVNFECQGKSPLAFRPRIFDLCDKE